MAGRPMTVPVAIVARNQSVEELIEIGLGA